MDRRRFRTLVLPAAAVCATGWLVLAWLVILPSLSDRDSDATVNVQSKFSEFDVSVRRNGGEICVRYEDRVAGGGGCADWNSVDVIQLARTTELTESGAFITAAGVGPGTVGQVVVGVAGLASEQAATATLDVDGVTITVWIVELDLTDGAAAASAELEVVGG